MAALAPASLAALGPRPGFCSGHQSLVAAGGCTGTWSALLSIRPRGCFGGAFFPIIAREPLAACVGSVSASISGGAIASDCSIRRVGSAGAGNRFKKSPLAARLPAPGRSSGLCQTKASSFPVTRRGRHPLVRHDPAGDPARVARRPQRPRQPFARIPRITVLGFFNFRHDLAHADRWPLISFDHRLHGFTRALIVASTYRGAGQGHRLFGVAWRKFGEVSRSCQTIGVRIAGTQIEINLRELRMRA